MTLPNKRPNILALPSEDGQPWMRLVQYPEHWDAAVADERAEGAIVAAQALHPEDWSWGDIEQELEKRGFILVSQHDGACWDTTR